MSDDCVKDCTFDPRTLKGAPMGQFHCPECGEMQVAGIGHICTCNDCCPGPQPPSQSQEAGESQEFSAKDKEEGASDGGQ